MENSQGGSGRVSHAPHYGGDVPYEAIKVIRAWGVGFSLGNALKYICRAGKKPGATTLEDLRKARWYVDEEIRHLEAAAEADRARAVSQGLEEPDGVEGPVKRGPFRRSVEHEAARVRELADPAYTPPDRKHGRDEVERV